MYIMLRNDPSKYNATYYKVLFLFVRCGTPSHNEQRNNIISLNVNIFTFIYIYIYVSCKHKRRALFYFVLILTLLY